MSVATQREQVMRLFRAGGIFVVMLILITLLALSPVLVQYVSPILPYTPPPLPPGDGDGDAGNAPWYLVQLQSLLS